MAKAPVKQWEPKTKEDKALIRQAEDGPPADLFGRIERRKDIKRRYESRQSLEEMPKAFELLPHGSVDIHPLTDRLRDIERMAYQGLKPHTIAARLALSLEEFREYALRYQDVELALTGGAARAADELSSQGMLVALEGDIRTLTFFLERRHGFYPYVPPPPAPVQVNVTNAPAAPPPVGFDRARELARRQFELIEGGAIDVTPDSAPDLKADLEATGEDILTLAAKEP